MDFARKQLEKYGWTDGKGLGRSENGISTAIKPKLKFDKAGLGHDPGEEFTNNWWNKAYDIAAQNIDVEVNEGEEVKVKVKSKEAVVIGTKESQLKTHSGYFLKTSKLTGNTMEALDTPLLDLKCLASTSYRAVTDEELFAACSGRTAHKGARHGIKQNGKLSRIEKQEKMLLKKMKKVSLSDNEDKSVAEKKLRKLKKQKCTGMNDSNTGKEKLLPNPKKKKKQKSVTFNDTVTVYPELDPSFDNEAGAKDENSNSSNQENLGSGSDEGIEQDCENNNNNNDSLDHHQSFEIAQFKINDLSKAERKKLKKKRKLQARNQSSSQMFLQKLNDEDANMTVDDVEDDNDNEDKDKNLKKRKFVEFSEQENYARNQSLLESPEKNKGKKNKKKRKKQKKLEEKQINFIVESFDNICQISQNNH